MPKLKFWGQFLNFKNRLALMSCGDFTKECILFFLKSLVKRCSVRATYAPANAHRAAQENSRN